MRRLLISATLATLIACNVLAEKVSKIEYVGCRRIDKETIEAYMPISVGDDCDDGVINDAVKILDSTGFFENVSIVMKGNTLVVTVVEYPIINAISYEGNKKLSDKDIEKVAHVRTRESLSPQKIREMQQLLLDAYRKMGRYSATVNPKIIKLPDNKVNLIFEINEGVEAGIGRIVFVGNENISSSDLRDVIHSKVWRWYRFFVTDDKYDSDRFNEDKVEIEKHYHNNGYMNAKVTSSVATLSSDRKEFTLTFTIDEGVQYRFGKVAVKSLVPKIKVDGVKEELYVKTGDEFNESLLETDSANIVRKIGSSGMAVVAKPRLVANDTSGTVDVVYEVTETERIYISKIVINGNTKTRDHIIRREIQIEEGDVYNQALVTLTERGIQDLGFFKKVDVQALPDPNSPDKCILQITVEEAPTAEAMASANYSPLGGIGVDLSYSEANLYGTGKALSVFIGSSRERTGRGQKAKFRFFNNVQVSLTDPHLLDKDIEGTVAVHRYVTSAWDGFSVKDIGGSCGISYALSRNWMQSWEYEAAGRKFTDIARGDARGRTSPIIIAQTTEGADDADIADRRNGKCGISSVKHIISYGKTFLTGIKGRFSASLSTSIAGLGGKAKHIKNELSCSYTIPVSRKSAVTAVLSYGMLSKLGGKHPHIVDSFMLGADSFRGFDYAGMGPMSETTRFYEVKDATGAITDRRPTVARDFIGGTRCWKGTIEYKFPLGMPEELQVRGFVFTDFGTVWRPTSNGSKYWQDLSADQTNIINAHNAPNDQYKFNIAEEDKKGCTFDNTVVGHKLYDKKKIRMSGGIGVAFVTPFGPIKLTYAIPFKREKYDEQYRFLISFATTM
ncbi:MAG: outer membrane protein assembly factor BamA [Holosporales bacterium]|nr:outer membrane protein assembly factor BamA [Holosporales bacterium]